MSPKPLAPHPAPACRVCLACHGSRLATLLETASVFRCYRVAPDDMTSLDSWPMPPGGLPDLAALLQAAGIECLICGGATCCCLTPFRQRGIAVAAWISGDVAAVLTALAQNRLEALLAPGARPGRLRAGRTGPGQLGQRPSHTEYEPS